MLFRSPRSARRRYGALVGGLLAAGAVTAGALSASALPISPVDGAPPRPTTRPPTTRATPPSTAIPRTLDSFVVTTSSVMGTATLNYSKLPAEITVRWGDNTFTTLTAGQIPGGSVTLTHEYTLPADFGAVTEVVTGQVDNDSDSRIVTVTPRFSVSQSEARLTPLDHCDPSYESETEFKVSQTLSDGHSTTTKNWSDEHVRTGNAILPGPFVAMRGSGFTRELTMAEAGAYVSYESYEMDTFTDDPAALGIVFLNPHLGTRHVRVGSTDCAAEITADLSVALLRPGLSSVPVAAPAPPPPPPPTSGGSGGGGGGPVGGGGGRPPIHEN
jgi:hypothetical protein